MPGTLTPEIEKLVQQQLDGDEFRSADDVLRAALRLLQQYQTHQRLRLDVKEGFDQIERGEATELEDDQALRTFFEDVKMRGHGRLQASLAP
jgi:putative addiction module CopG family antidote